jgi:hypothetical protein
MRGATIGATSLSRTLRPYFLGAFDRDLTGVAAFLNTLRTSPRFGIGISCPFGVFCFVFLLMIYKTCLFCIRNDSKPNREDVLANWIAREFPADRWECTIYSTKEKFKTRRKSFDLICKKICSRCNSTWMAKLEEKAKPILQPLLHGDSCTLTLVQQALLARWLIKTVTALDLIDEEPFFFQQSERTALMKSLKIPRLTLISLALYSGSRIVETHHMPINLKLQTPNPINATRIKGYSATLLIKHLALQVFCIRSPYLHRQLSLRMEADRWADATVQLWPAKKLIRWPPAFYLDDAHFDLFTNRWLTLMSSP